MNQGIYPLAATMINQLNRVDVISNNLANANTTGFKQDNLTEGSFNYYLSQKLANNEDVTLINKITNTIPKIDSKFVDQSLGAIVPTDNLFDFAIKKEDVFFKIKNPNNNETLLTRDGTFHILNGQLVTKNGYEVLGIDDEPILAQGDFAQQIGLVETSFENLQKQGNNNYTILSQENVEQLTTNENYMLQGALEKSNINSVATMVSLIDSHRRFDQAQKAMTGIDEINQKVIDKLGSNR